MSNLLKVSGLTWVQISFIDLNPICGCNYCKIFLCSCSTEGVCGASCLLTNPHPRPCPLVTLVQLAKGNLSLPLPKLNTLGKVLGLLKGVEVFEVEVLGCWSTTRGKFWKSMLK